jgi:tetraacyldisaccharide-1-P 4'-kinase
MLSGRSVSANEIRNTKVLVAAGIADPHSFAMQCKALGATVSLIAWRDHRRLSERDVLRMVRASSKADYVVVTEKDAVKLRRLWPRNSPEPLVAALDLIWERGGAVVRAALDAAVADVEELVS